MLLHQYFFPQLVEASSHPLPALVRDKVARRSFGTVPICWHDFIVTTVLRHT